MFKRLSVAVCSTLLLFTAVGCSDSMDPDKGSEDSATTGSKADCMYTEDCSIGTDPIGEPDFEKSVQERLDQNAFAGLDEPAEGIKVVSRIATFEEYQGPSAYERNMMVKVRGKLAETIANAVEQTDDELDYVGCDGSDQCVVDIANQTNGYSDAFEIEDDAGDKRGVTELANILSDTDEDGPVTLSEGPISCEPGAYGDDRWQTCDFNYDYLSSETADDRALVALTYNNTYEGSEDISTEARPPRDDFREGFFETPEKNYSTGEAPLRSVGSNVVQVLSVPRDILESARAYSVQNGPEARSGYFEFDGNAETVSRSSSDARFALYIPNFRTDQNQGDDSSNTSDGVKSEALNLVNNASLEMLDEKVGLDSRAAENIVDYRLGEDGEQGTEDDHQFESIEQLRRIDYVADTAIEKLKTYVDSQ